MSFETSQEAYDYLTTIDIEDPLSIEELQQIINKSHLHFYFAMRYKNVNELLYNYHSNCVYYYNNLYLNRYQLMTTSNTNGSL
jgi:hypothetical protein